MEKNSSKLVSQAAMIAALYTVLTLISSAFGLSSGHIQLRISECLCILPIFSFSAVPGIFLGCLLSNIITGGTILDVIFGSIASLLGAMGTFALKKRPVLSTFAPVLSNTIIIPFILQKSYGLSDSYIYLAAFIFIGELLSCTGLGSILYFALNKRPNFLQ